MLILTSEWHTIFNYQPIDESTLWELEQMEKELDIDDILSYRSAAECESQVRYLVYIWKYYNIFPYIEPFLGSIFVKCSWQIFPVGKFRCFYPCEFYVAAGVFGELFNWKIPWMAALGISWYARGWRNRWFGSIFWGCFWCSY